MPLDATDSGSTAATATSVIPGANMYQALVGHVDYVMLAGSHNSAIVTGAGI